MSRAFCLVEGPQCGRCWKWRESARATAGLRSFASSLHRQPSNMKSFNHPPYRECTGTHTCPRRYKYLRTHISIYTCGYKATYARAKSGLLKYVLPRLKRLRNTLTEVYRHRPTCTYTRHRMHVTEPHTRTHALSLILKRRFHIAFHSTRKKEGHIAFSAYTGKYAENQRAVERVER